jgi:sugar phosphate isomerase/epimerase
MQGFAVSNIAWPFTDRIEAYGLMVAHDVTGLEIAPGMLFADASDAFNPPAHLIRERLAEIAAAGLALVSMQSLLFGVEGAALFGDASQRRTYVDALGRAVRIAGALGIPHLVLGSPRERNIPEGMPDAEVAKIATEVLADLAEVAQAHGCRIGLEPNPAVYGTNFATHTDIAARIVREIGHPGLCLTLDIGNLQINREMHDLGKIVARNVDIIGHAHLSEPDLALAPGNAEMAAEVISVLQDAGYAGWLSVEMRASGPRSCEALLLALGRLKTARALN